MPTLEIESTNKIKGYFVELSKEIDKLHAMSIKSGEQIKVGVEKFMDELSQNLFFLLMETVKKLPQDSAFISEDANIVQTSGQKTKNNFKTLNR